MSCQRVLPGALQPGDTVERLHHVQLDPLPRVVATARNFVREHAPALPDDTIDVLLLLTSELVTNAVLHARTSIEVGLAVAQRSVLITVHDEDLARPEQLPYAGREGGWGLGLVSALAQTSALTSHPGDGKTAWFVLPRGETTDAEPGVAQRAGQDDLGAAGLTP